MTSTIRRSAGILALALSSCALNAAAAGSAAETAQGAASCRALGDFYWEIGNARGVLASGQVGDDYSANKEIQLASASKFVWGAYVLEKIGKGQTPSQEQVDFLEMKSGYTAFNPLFCLLSRSVGSCMDARSNSERENRNVGKFFYGGGHDQRMAASMGFGRFSADQLTGEVMGLIGSDLDLRYKRPQPAGGMEGTPAAYGGFLRKILSGELRMKEFLGYQPVCAYPGGDCPTALSSPVKERWHYSLNHWVEDDPKTGDGAFSSPGLMGFYPWISADKTTYGLVARQTLSKSAYWDSVECGRDIRAAWMKHR